MNKINFAQLRKILFSISFLLLISIYVNPLITQERRGNLDLITIIDLSRSMVGGGGTANIFHRVQQSCKDILNELQEGDNYTLITFGESVMSYPTVTLRDAEDRKRVNNIINNLIANQNWTFTAAALKAGLEEANRLEVKNPDHKKLIFILTDGINNPPPGSRASGPTLSEAASHYRNKDWFVYQVQYGQTIDQQLDSVIKTNWSGGTISDSGATGGIDKLRPIIEEQKKQELKWIVDPDKVVIVLDTVGLQVQSSNRVILPEQITLTDITVKLLSGSIPKQIELTQDFYTSENNQLNLKVIAKCNEKIQNAEYEGKLRFELSRNIEGISLLPYEIPLVIKTRFIPPVWHYWLIGIILFLLLLLLIRWLISLKNARKLYGKLQYWPKIDPSQKVPHKDLSEFGSKIIIGSTEIKIPGDKPLAILKNKKVEGNYFVCVYPFENVKLFFNGKQMSELILYNNDIFELDDYQFKYSDAATGVRPRRSL